MAFTFVYRCSCGDLYPIDDTGVGDLETHLAANPTHAATESYADGSSGDGQLNEVTLASPGGTIYRIGVSNDGSVTTTNGGTGQPVSVAPNNNYTATSNPGSSNDNTEGYSVGSSWINTNNDTQFVCADASTGAAVWKGTTGETNTIAGSSGITNTGDNINAVLTPTYGSSANTITQGNDSRLSDARTPTGAAGGGLSGTYPNPTVVDTSNIAQYRQTGNLTINTTATTVVLNANDFEDSAYSRSGSDITINTAGVYKVTYSVFFDTNANARRTIDVWVENNTVEITPSRSGDYSRNSTDDTGSAGASFFVQLAASDVLRIRAQSTGTSGSCLGIGNRMWIALELVRGV